jgi:hypothetical protein
MQASSSLKIQHKNAVVTPFKGAASFKAEPSRHEFIFG